MCLRSHFKVAFTQRKVELSKELRRSRSSRNGGLPLQEQPMGQKWGWHRGEPGHPRMEELNEWPQNGDHWSRKWPPPCAFTPG
uniref:Putative uncharacterized protein KLHL30-AS1 n=1 Tax=Homo sapiens TaxID=9606 RepID=KLAS1_HUMAN